MNSKLKKSAMQKQAYKIIIRTLLAIFLLTILGFSTYAQTCMKPAYTVTGDSLIIGGCIINGDLTILDGGKLEVDLTGSFPDTFIVRGDILINGNGKLIIYADPGATNEQFIISNNSNSERTIILNDNSSIVIEDVEFRTQEGNLTGAQSIYMECISSDNSSFTATRCFLDQATAWLLYQLNNDAKTNITNCSHFPTEIYVHDNSIAKFHGTDTNLGIWMDFDNITDTVNLPMQGGAYSWKIGQGFGGINTNWLVDIDNAEIGLGLNIYPTAQLTINGNGTPSTGEVTIGLFYANGTDTLTNLQAGLQNTTIDNRLTFNNVQLGPIAWQIYLLMNETLYINNSVINEIGVVGPSQVIVDSSLLQLAVLASIGNNSSMTINNSEVWNQFVQAANNSSIIFNNCDIIGSLFTAMDMTSDITVNNGCFYENPIGCTPATMVNISTGQPYCNPFSQPGYPQIMSVGAVNLNNVDNCGVLSAVEIHQESIDDIIVFPNPSNFEVTIKLDNYLSDSYSIRIYDIMGRQLLHLPNIGDPQITIDIRNLSNGIYLLQYQSRKGRTITKKILIE